ncbi:hypothetical protein SLS64_009546 [Diaporthe eres]|uniref:Tse2 ADP-ribosyltransferase toxin domain-containing protein n=1 Tax=Diaporthe eres TaxID=83184 RepID=A0ABR1NSD3_DIAER
MPAVNYYIAIPVTLYRMTLGGKVKVRKHTADAGAKFDIVAEGLDEIVKPKFQDLKNYQAPNGVSMRPMNSAQKDLIETFSGSNVQVACIPKDFQSMVQEFLKEKASATERLQWLLKNKAPVQAHGPNKEPLKWSTKARKWYYTDSKTKKDVFVASKQ